MRNLDGISVLIRAQADTSGFTQTTQAAQAMERNVNTSVNNIGSMMSKLGKIALTAFSVKAITNFGQSCLQVGANVAEVQNVVEQTFKKLSKSADVFAASTVKTLGIGPTMAKQMVGTYGAMAKAFSFSEEEALDMSTTITKLNGDIASFYNISAEAAMTKTKAIFSGETESLKDLGIVMTQSALDQYAMANGWGKTTAKMTEQEKVLLRYNFLLDRTKDVQGDFERNQNSWANQVKILSEQFSILKGEIGVGLIQAFTPVIQIVNKFIERLTVAASAFRSFMELKFNVDIGTSTGLISSDIGNIEDTAEDASDSINGIGSAAAAAAKKIGALAGFDKLNVLTKSTDSGSTSSVPTLPSIMAPTQISPIIEEIETDGIGEKLSDMFGNIKAALPVFDFSNMIDSFNKIKEAVEPLAVNLFDGLIWCYENAIKPIAEWAVNDAVPAFLNVFAGALTVLNPLIESLKPIASWLFDSFLKPIAEWTGGVIVDTLNGLADALTKIGGWMSDNEDVITKSAIAVGGFFAAWKGIELMGFIQMSGGIIAAVKGITSAIVLGTAAKLLDKLETMYLTALYAKDFVVSLAKGTAAIAKQAAQFVIHKGVLVASKIAQLAMNASTIAWNAICTTASAITWAFGAAVAFLTSPIGLVILAVAGLIAGIVLLIKNWDKVKEVASNVWAGVVSTTSAAITNVKQVMGGISSWVSTTIISPISNAFSSFWASTKSGFSSLFNGIKTMAKAPFNFIIDMLNTIIKGLNSIKFDVPDWVPNIGGKSLGVNLNTIPKLATGGVVDQTTIAMIGEAGKEAVIPLQNTNVFDQIGASVANALVRVGQDSGQSKAQTTTDVKLELDGQTIGQIIFPHVMNEGTRLGIL